jgi:hypothetical protein
VFKPFVVKLKNKQDVRNFKEYAICNKYSEKDEVRRARELFKNHKRAKTRE